ncbi:NepR family anti-sigma factor [Pseudoruegeria sp. SK021]|uniref:NepR family anti-sigma factor n=1 Tax=Pseudoruegeria sp. SK021 TaxID=1933035 RepID=UPI00352D2249
MDEAKSGESGSDIEFLMCILYGTKRLVAAFGSVRKRRIGYFMWADMDHNEDTSGLKSQIDENLKRVYREALEEDVPDRFKDLLEQLRKKESGK